MQYIKVQFSNGFDAVGYQCIDDNGNCVEYRDEAGTVLHLPEVYECDVIDSAPDFPIWGVKDVAEPASNFGTTKVGDEVIPGDE